MNSYYGRQDPAPRYQGTFRERRFQRPSSPPLFQEARAIGLLSGSGGTVFTQVRVLLRPATIVFPGPGLMLSFSNGEARTFSKVTPQELASLGAWMTEMSQKVQSTYDEQIKVGARLALYRRAAETGQVPPELAAEIQAESQAHPERFPEEQQPPPAPPGYGYGNYRAGGP